MLGMGREYKARVIAVAYPRNLLNNLHVSQPLGSDAAGAKAGPTASGPIGRWRVEVGSCRVAGGDGTLANDRAPRPEVRRVLFEHGKVFSNRLLERQERR
jgi:hypothetical protein